MHALASNANQELSSRENGPWDLNGRQSKAMTYTSKSCFDQTTNLAKQPNNQVLRKCFERKKQKHIEDVMIPQRALGGGQQGNVRRSDDSTKGAFISLNILQISGGVGGGPYDVRRSDHSTKGALIFVKTLQISGGLGGGGGRKPPHDVRRSDDSTKGASTDSRNPC